VHRKRQHRSTEYLHTTKCVKNIGCPSSERLRQQVFTYQHGGIPDVGWQIEKLGDRKNLEAAGTKIETRGFIAFFIAAETLQSGARLLQFV